MSAQTLARANVLAWLRSLGMSITAAHPFFSPAPEPVGAGGGGMGGGMNGVTPSALELCKSSAAEPLLPLSWLSAHF